MAARRGLHPEVVRPGSISVKVPPLLAAESPRKAKQESGLKKSTRVGFVSFAICGLKKHDRAGQRALSSARLQ